MPLFRSPVLPSAPVFPSTGARTIAKVLVLAGLLVAPSVDATTHLYDQLPAAPQSCNTCHTNGPGTARNAFGLQVEANLDGDGATGIINWPTLCGLDADNDGSTNGAELGDPCCLFEVGNTIFDPVTDPNNALDVSFNTCDSNDGGTPVVVPPGWTCSAAQLDDGHCDCGCGVFDADCTGPTFATCEYSGCGDGVVDVLDPTQCLNAVEDSPWTCGFAAYGDGATCDCGCGVVDPDCDSLAIAACEASGCRPGTEVSSDDTTTCVQAAAFTGARPGWWCPAAWYAGDDGCDCGCGLIDPDCPRAPQGSDCAQQGCIYGPVPAQTEVDTNNLAQCVEMGTAPAAWTCDANWYAAGDGCDCGCGIADPDCEAESFEYCAHSGCPDDLVVDKRDFTVCSEPVVESCGQTTSSSFGGLLGLGMIVLFNRRKLFLNRRRRRQRGEGS